MNLDVQQRLLGRITAAAEAEDCLVAPVGSVYFLLIGSPKQTTKDVDAVLHTRELQAPPLETVQRVAARLGEAQLTGDEAVVKVRTADSDVPEIELIRGRRAAKGGFFPRDLLQDAAAHAQRRGNILLYPIEYIIVLKADGAVDREERAAKDPTRAEEHLRRSRDFAGEVIVEVNRALLAGTLDVRRLARAVSYLKKNRQDRIRALLAGAGAAFEPR